MHILLSGLTYQVFSDIHNYPLNMGFVISDLQASGKIIFPGAHSYNEGGQDVDWDLVRPEATLPSTVPPEGSSASRAPPLSLCLRPWKLPGPSFPLREAPSTLPGTWLETLVSSSPPPSVLPPD